MAKATEDQLSELHSQLTQALLSKVVNREATASDLNVIRQFLKDNNISSDIGSNPGLAALEQSLPSVEDLDNMPIGGVSYTH